VLVIRRNVPGRYLLIALVFLVFASAPARAAEADPAAQAYHRALERYAAGDRVGALTSMRESHRLSGRSELLYNIARLEDELGDCASALADYQLYLQRVPQGQYRSQAERAAAELTTRCPVVAPEPAPTDAPAAASSAVVPRSAAVAQPEAASPLPPEPEPYTPASTPGGAPAPPPNTAGSTQRWLGWSAIAAGGLAGIGALYFTVSAFDARARFRSSLEREVEGGPFADFGLQDEQHRDQRVAQVLAVTGGALLGGGVVLLALGARRPASAAVTARVWYTPGRVAAQLSTSF